MSDGEQVLDLLASHPGTARFVCTKIARRLLTDHPDPALVDHLAAVFLSASAAPDQIAQVIRALVTHSSFESTPPAKLRRPFEFLTALYRATGAEITGTENTQQYQLMRAGWRQHEYGPPTGHPDTLDKWTGASSLNRLIDFALVGHDDGFGVATLDLGQTENGETLGAFPPRWSGEIGSEPAGLAEAMGIDPAAAASDLSNDERKAIAAAAIAFAALTPQFLLR